MEQGSLESVMEQMIRRLSGLCPDESSQPDPLKDLDSFASADPVLASLHKEYLEARIRNRILAQTNGPEDPMTEVARDMFDSVRSAIQTRMIELQHIREVEVRALMARRLRAQKAEEEVARAQAEKESKKRSDVFFWFFMLLWMMQKTWNAAGHHLSAAGDFALVAGADQNNRTRYA